MTRDFLVDSVSELKDLAKFIADLLNQYPVACFYGEMGAGKTTLIKEVCKEFGVTDDTSSPTFSIVNEYQDGSGKPIFHFDFYRIKNLREALDTGAADYLESGDPCLIEWPELIIDLIPVKHLEININLVGMNSRMIKVNPRG